MFVAQSIGYFQRQDYINKELVILDDGQDCVEDLIPEDPCIRYVHLPNRLSLGAKRNLACELSKGDLIAHWDDDDWMAPSRITTQVHRLCDSQAEVCGLDSLLYYQPSAGRAWLYRYPEHERPWLAGGTLLYRRSAWRSNRFPDVEVGEDTAFLWGLAPAALHNIEDRSWYVGLLHKANTAAKCLDDVRWTPGSLDEVGCLLSWDREFYVALRRGKAGSAVVECDSDAEIHLAAPFLVYDGYGSMAEHLALGMNLVGVRLNLVPLELDREGTTGELKALLEQARPYRGGTVLYFCWPRSDLDRFRNASNLFIYTMWEGSRLPAGWADTLNRARAVLVPTRFVARVCRDSGVRVPIEIVPQGADSALYPYMERPRRAGLTTLIVATVTARKHVAEGVAAWKQAFAGDAAARLIIKSRFQFNNYTPDDPRIRLVDSNETTRGIAHWYRQADVLLALGNEGFGLPLVEGMASGLPVIALDSEGQSDVCEDAGGCLLPVSPGHWEPCDEAPFGPGGVRAVPSVEQVAGHLRWVAEHPEQARALGRAASRWAHRQRDLSRMGPAALEAMERHIHPVRQLRRRYTFWVSSWGKSCGVAEYTRHIAEHLSDVRVSGTLADMRGVRVLHVQHEHSLVDEAELRQALYDAKAHKVPVVITEHAVDDMPRPWEGEADALVALTRSGVERLRARWPHRRVEHIPHGCPTWFPPRKADRGKTIGVFGFLGRHKGFWRLLDVLRELPDARLVMFSHTKDPGLERQWEQAAEGLAVDRCRAFLPSQEIAARLAAQADILVYWYDAIASASASGAVRIGLASGVPVLSSAVPWFEDVREVTYQPQDLASGVRRLLQDESLRKELVQKAREFCHAMSWAHTAQAHRRLWRDLE
jgi:glycosyltransferase involved in cell wall biosynthesis